MGIKNLGKFISDNNNNSSITDITINDLEDKILAIDASIILYQFLIAIKNDIKPKDEKDTSHIYAIITKVLTYINKRIYPIFVFDGKPPEIKTKTLKYRNELKNKALQNLEKDLSDEEKTKMLKRSLKITEQQIFECQEILTLLGIPFIISPGEADPQCAYLVKEGIADAVVSEDMDILTFGTNKLIRGLTTKHIQLYNLDNILKDLDISYEQFIELCILFGCDYCYTVKGIGIKRAYELIKKYKNIDEIKNNTKYEFPKNYNYNEIIEYFKNPPVINVEKKDIIWNKPNFELLKKKLIENYNYSYVNVDNIINSLNDGYYNVICGNIEKSNFKPKRRYIFSD